MSLIKLDKAKRKVLHISWGNPKHKYRLGGEWIERSPEEKDLQVLADKKLGMTEKCAFTAQKANPILGCIRRGVASTLREVILLLCSSHEMPPRVLHLAVRPSAQEIHVLVRVGPEEGQENDQSNGTSLL